MGGNTEYRALTESGPRRCDFLFRRTALSLLAIVLLLPNRICEGHHKGYGIGQE